MRNLLFKIVLFFANIFFVSSIFAQEINIEEEKNKQKLFELGVTANFEKSISYFDKNGKVQVTDTIYYQKEGDSTVAYYPYTTDKARRNYVLDVSVYNPLTNYFLKQLTVELPFSYYSIKEQFTNDSAVLARKYTRNEDSRYEFDGHGFDLSLFRINTKYIDFDIFTKLYIPFYKYESLSDSTEDIMYNKKIELGREKEFALASNVRAKISKFRFGIEGIYQMRAGDFTDRILSKLYLAFSNVKNTEIYTNLNYIYSLGEYQEKYKVSQWRTTLYERYFDAEVGFKIAFTENWVADIAYAVKIWGENTPARNNIRLNLAYVFTK